MKVTGAYIVFTAKEHSVSPPPLSLQPLDGQTFSSSHRTLVLFKEVVTVLGGVYGEKARESVSLDVRDHEFFFSFEIPPFSPPSIEVPNKGYIRYSLQFVVTWNNLIGSGEQVGSKDVIVGNQVDPSVISQENLKGEIIKSIGLAKFLLSETAPFRAKVQLARGVTYPEDLLKFHLLIINPTNRVLNELNIRIVRHLDFGTQSCDENIAKYTITDGFPLEQRQSVNKEFGILLPDKNILLPSFRGHLLGLSYTIVFDFPGMSFTTSWKLMLPLSVSSVPDDYLFDNPESKPFLSETETVKETIPPLPSRDSSSGYFLDEPVLPETLTNENDELSSDIPFEDVLPGMVLARDALIANLLNLAKNENGRLLLRTMFLNFEIDVAEGEIVNCITELAEYLLTSH
eukprot:TRINITY_DN4774_c0_g1_i1.p1 TRINITY_DN4774_c0_g1~~TRINITY_DN4774_c0_g1_i1.p1  ORF type:complete len:465 (+),score=78.38 TRINITY_DN4774_c0_g1_i1:195-1397(+)